MLPKDTPLHLSATEDAGTDWETWFQEHPWSQLTAGTPGFVSMFLLGKKGGTTFQVNKKTVKFSGVQTNLQAGPNGTGFSQLLVAKNRPR